MKPRQHQTRLAVFSTAGSSQGGMSRYGGRGLRKEGMTSVVAMSVVLEYRDSHSQGDCRKSGVYLECVSSCFTRRFTVNASTRKDSIMNSLVRRSPRLIARRRYATLVGTDQRGHGADKETLVVVGGGWAGYNFVRKLDKVSPSRRNSAHLDSPDPASVPLQSHLHQREHQFCYHSTPPQLGFRLSRLPRYRRTPPIDLGALLPPLLGGTRQLREPDGHLSPRVESRISRKGSARKGTATGRSSGNTGEAQGDV